MTKGPVGDGIQEFSESAHMSIKTYFQYLPVWSGISYLQSNVPTNVDSLPEEMVFLQNSYFFLYVFYMVHITGLSPPPQPGIQSPQSFFAL